MNNPLVSICIPTYKNEKTIAASIDSALKQTYSNIEIIVVDNCSPDKTLAIVNSFNDPKIKVFKNENNIGMCGNWNRCLDYASGEYIHYLHGDDVLFQNCVEKKINLAKQDSDIVLVFSATEIINSNDKPLMIRRYKNKNLILDGQKLAYESLYKRNIFGEPSNVLFKRKILEYTNPFCKELKYATDWELWLRLACFGKIGYIADVLSKYRISDNNTTSSLIIKEILKDDAVMINQLQKSGKFKLSFHQIFIHKLILYLRAVARTVYMKMISNKAKN